MTTQPQSQPLSTTHVKDMSGERRDCCIKWQVDSGKMQLDLHVDFIPPTALLRFVERLGQTDERFLKTNLTSVADICNRFTVKVWVSHGDKQVCYRLKAYRPEMSNGSHPTLEAELTPIGTDTSSDTRRPSYMTRAMTALLCYHGDADDRSEGGFPMKTQNSQSSGKTPEQDGTAQGQCQTPPGPQTLRDKQENCEHEWQRDGQTMTAQRWTCRKCGKTQLAGIDI